MRTEDPMDLAALGMPSDNDSLTGVLRDLEASGFGASYRPAREPVEGQAAVMCGSCRRSTPARDLVVSQERRMEGASDPDDLVLAVAATCPACGTGGVIVLGYGPEASQEDSDIVVALRSPAAAATGGDDDDDGESTSDPGGDSDPDANEGFEPPSDRSGPTGLGRVGAAIDRVGALDVVGDPLHRAIDRHLPQRVRDVLQGRWLGHSLHPMLTDLPIGFWTSAWVLDVVGAERTEAAADAFVAAGVATAIPTLWSGWSDWIELPREKRRSGLVHAFSNGTATALYGASFLARRRGDRTLGVRLGHAGAAVATVGGFLGGHLAFGDD